MSHSRNRLVAGVAAWVAAVAVALAVGLSAVGAIGSGLLGPGPQPLTPAEVDARLAATDPAEPAVAAPPQPPAAAPVDPATAPDVVATEGGTILARCTGDVADVVSATPAQGFRVQTESEDGGPRVRFRAGKTRIEVHLSCAGGRPVAEVKNDS